MEDCIFCKIVRKEAPSHIVWEDHSYLAFLSIFPNTLGVTVVIPKKHYASYAFELPDKILTEFILATKNVGKLLDKALPGVGRTAMVFEGYGVNHVHAKLYPLHGTGDVKKWKPILSNVDTYFEKYEGYISTHDAKRADDAKLAELVNKIRKAANNNA